MLEPLFNSVAGLQTCNFIEKRPWHRWFFVINAKYLRTSFWETSFRTAASEDLSGAATVIFRRYFFFFFMKFHENLWKTHMLESLFNNFWDILSEVLSNERLHHGYFSMKKFYLKNTFLRGHLRATASDTYKTWHSNL